MWLPPEAVWIRLCRTVRDGNGKEKQSCAVSLRSMSYWYAKSRKGGFRRALYIPPRERAIIIDLADEAVAYWISLCGYRAIIDRLT